MSDLTDQQKAELAQRADTQSLEQIASGGGSDAAIAQAALDRR